ncbi:MAG: hypothetical protein ACI9UK_000916 [Candidatus Krumholzibacteriia bacterium]|jgi:uncharacterized protein YlxP (DUF503 family)
MQPKGQHLDDVRVFTGTLIADLVLPYAHSLKERRGPLRALVQKLKNQDLAVAQVGPADLHQRVFLAISAISSSESQLEKLLDMAERLLLSREFEVANVLRDINVESFRSD